MAANEILSRAVDITMPAPIAANSGVGPISGDPLMYGRGTSPGFGLAGVAETSYTPPTGVPTGNISVKFEGAFLLPVLAKASVGGGNVAVFIGDKLYAEGGTYDQTTGCYYGFTLTTNASSGAYYGNALDAVVAGATTTIRVRLKVSGD